MDHYHNFGAQFNRGKQVLQQFSVHSVYTTGQIAIRPLLELLLLKPEHDRNFIIQRMVTRPGFSNTTGTSNSATGTYALLFRIPRTEM